MGLWAIAAAAPGRTAVIDPDGRSVSYAELAARADRYGRGLQALGLRPGNSVAGLLPNGTDALAIFFAAIQTGLYAVPVNWHLTAAEVAYILGDSGASAFVAHERFADIAADAAQAAGIDPGASFAVGEIPGFTPMTALGAFGLTPFDDNVHLCCSPLYHTAVLNFATISIQLGHPVVLMDHFQPEETLALIERHRVTHSHMVPTQFRRLLGLPQPARDRYDTSSLRAVIHSAAPCPRDVKRQMIDWWGPVVTEYYAASEGGGTAITAREWLARPGSVGKAWLGTEVRVLDAEGNDAPAGETGLVYMRMGASTFDYHKDEEKTRASRARGMFTVGDIGYLDADGYLYLCDRKSDMIISGGVNVYPAEIEAELSGHPAVADVAVFGIPHDDWGEEIKAVVQPAAGVEPGPELTGELLAFLGERVARFKLPRTIDYVQELPRDPNGKLYKRRLRDPYWVGRDRAI